jgi:Ca2+/Na+ antiporter
MKKHKKGRSLGLMDYSRTTRLFYFLILAMLLLGSQLVFKAYNQLPILDWKSFGTVIVVLVFVYSVFQFCKRAKEESEENNLDY